MSESDESDINHKIDELELLVDKLDDAKPGECHIDGTFSARVKSLETAAERLEFERSIEGRMAHLEKRVTKEKTHEKSLEQRFISFQQEAVSVAETQKKHSKDVEEIKEAHKDIVATKDKHEKDVQNVKAVTQNLADEHVKHVETVKNLTGRVSNLENVQVLSERLTNIEKNVGSSKAIDTVSTPGNDPRVTILEKTVADLAAKLSQCGDAKTQSSLSDRITCVEKLLGESVQRLSSVESLLNETLKKSPQMVKAPEGSSSPSKMSAAVTDSQAKILEDKLNAVYNEMHDVTSCIEQRLSLAEKIIGESSGKHVQATKAIDAATKAIDAAHGKAEAAHAKAEKAESKHAELSAKVDKKLQEVASSPQKDKGEKGEQKAEVKDVSKLQKDLNDVHSHLEKRMGKVETSVAVSTETHVKSIKQMDAAHARIEDLQVAMEKRLDEFETLLRSGSKDIEKCFNSLRDERTLAHDRLESTAQTTSSQVADSCQRYENLMKLLEEEWASEHRVRQLYQDRSMETIMQERRTREAEWQILEQRLSTFEKKVWRILDRQSLSGTDLPRELLPGSTEVPVATGPPGVASIKRIAASPNVPMPPSIQSLPGLQTLVQAAPIVPTTTIGPQRVIPPEPRARTPFGSVILQRSNSGSPMPGRRPVQVLGVQSSPLPGVRVLEVDNMNTGEEQFYVNLSGATMPMELT